MTEYEQGSAWICEYVVNSIYRSPVVVLKIASKIALVLKHRFTCIEYFFQPDDLRNSTMLIELLTKPNHD